jgi:hypothetical protein
MKNAGTERAEREEPSMRGRSGGVERGWYTGSVSFRHSCPRGVVAARRAGVPCVSSRLAHSLVARESVHVESDCVSKRDTS